MVEKKNSCKYSSKLLFFFSREITEQTGQSIGALMSILSSWAFICLGNEASCLNTVMQIVHSGEGTVGFGGFFNFFNFLEMNQNWNLKIV